MTPHLKLMLIVTLAVVTSSCVSHRNVLNDPVSVLGQWDKLDATPPGTRINVELRTGMIVSGSFQGSTAEQVRVSMESGAEMSIAKTDVDQISAAEADSLKNGTLWGLGIGGALALGAGLEGGDGSAAVAVTNLVGAVSLGLLLDWLRQEHDVIYIGGGTN